MLKVKRGELLAIVVTCTRQGTGRVDAVFWGYLLLVDGDIKCGLDYSAAGDGTDQLGRKSQNERWFTSVDRRRTDAQENRQKLGSSVCIYVRRVRDSRKSRHTKQL